MRRYGWMHSPPPLMFRTRAVTCPCGNPAKVCEECYRKDCVATHADRLEKRKASKASYREKANERRRKRRIERRAKGRCVDCKKKCQPGYRYCKRCRKAYHDRNLRWREGGVHLEKSSAIEW